MVTDPQTHTNKPTDMTDYNTLIHCAAKLSAQCKKVLTKVRSKRIACDRFVSRKLFNRVNVPAACIEPIYILYNVQCSYSKREQILYSRATVRYLARVASDAEQGSDDVHGPYGLSGLCHEPARPPAC